MDKSIELEISSKNMPMLWCVTQICGDNKCLSSGLIHPNSIRLLYVSDSFLSCLKMAFQRMPKSLGGRRPITESCTSIQKISIDALMKLLRNQSELSADNYDDEYGSSYRASYAYNLLAIWVSMLMCRKDIDFRKPDAGIHASEVKKCLR